MNNNLTAELRPDKTGKMVTRHVRTDRGTVPAGRTKALSGAAPSAGSAKKNTFKKTFTEFSFADAPREDYVPASVEKTVDGWKSTSVGSNYSGSYQRTVEVAKCLREDLKEAIDAGYLPDGLKYGVKASSASMTQDLTVSVSGLPDSMIYSGVGTDRHGFERMQLTDFAQKLTERLETMVNSYNNETRDSGNDYYHHSFYSYVELKDEKSVQWAAEEAARKKRAREAAIEKNLG
jgi:hypothetical protein